MKVSSILCYAVYILEPLQLRVLKTNVCQILWICIFTFIMSAPLLPIEALVIHRIFSIFCSLLHTFITSLMTSFCDKISMVYHSIVWHFLYSDHQSIFKRRKKKKNVVVAWGEIRQVCRKIPKGCFASSLLCFPQLHFFSMLTWASQLFGCSIYCITAATVMRVSQEFLRHSVYAKDGFPI